MTTAARVRYLIERHGDTIRSAAKRIGCPKSTLSDLLNGAEAHLDRRVELVARAYGVDPDSLMPGRSPQADFVWSVRCATTRERLEFMFLTIQERLRMTLEYLENGYPQRFSPMAVASASGMKLHDFIKMKAQWDFIPPDMVLAQAIIRGLSDLSGICRPWFLSGAMQDENGAAAVVKSVAKAYFPGIGSSPGNRAGLTPKVVEAAQRRLASISAPSVGVCA